MLFGTEELEIAILNQLHDALNCGFMDSLMMGASFLGNGGVVWIVLGLGMLFTKKYRRHGEVMLISLALCLVLGNFVLKPLIARPRPCWIYDGADMLIGIPADFSFPSGHTHSSFAAAFAAYAANKRIGTASMVVACLIAFSRMYLFVHFPTDIIGGIALAFLVTYPLIKSDGIWKKLKEVLRQGKQ